MSLSSCHGGRPVLAICDGFNAAAAVDPGAAGGCTLTGVFSVVPDTGGRETELTFVS